jgi:hypothetical protein
LAKEARLPARYLGPKKASIGRFGVPRNLIDSPKSLKSFKIRSGSSTVALTNLATFGVAVEATILEVEVEVENRY